MIKKIVDTLKERNEKIAFVRAYYNVSSISFRVNSDYFANLSGLFAYPN